MTTSAPPELTDRASSPGTAWVRLRDVAAGYRAARAAAAECEVARARAEAAGEAEWEAISPDTPVAELSRLRDLTDQYQDAADDARARAGSAQAEADRIHHAYLDARQAPRDGQAYRRTGGAAWLERARLLPPVPRGTEMVVHDPAEFSQVRGYPVLAAALSLGVWMSAVLGYRLLPGSRTTVVSTVGSDQLNSVLGWTFTFVLGAAVVLGVLDVVRTRRFRLWHVACRASLREELVFRAGSETWSRRQQALSCVTFGAAHLVNLIWSVWCCALLVVVGAAVNGVYLHQLRCGATRRTATISAAKFHAYFNAASCVSAAAIGVCALVTYNGG